MNEWDCYLRGRSENEVQLTTGSLFPRYADVGVVSSDPLLPWVTLRIEVEDGRPVVTKILAERPANGSGEVNGDRLRDLPMAALTADAIEHVAHAAWWERQGQVDAADPNMRSGLIADLNLGGRASEAQQAVQAHGRRSVTLSLLEQVATIYNADETGKPTQAVQLGLSTGHRNAARLVGLAREKDLILPYQRSKG